MNKQQWRAVYIERCTYGSERGLWVIVIEIWRGTAFLLYFKNPIDLLFEELEEKDPGHFAVLQYKSYKLAAGKTAKSILISCSARLSPFSIKEVRDVMSADELELDKLGGFVKRVKNKKTGVYEDKIIKRKTALFVIISDTDASFDVSYKGWK